MNELQAILPHLAPAGMVMARVSGIFLYAPVLSSVLIPRMVKVLLIISLTFAVYMGILPILQANGSFDRDWTIWSVVPALGFELMMGLIVGFAAMLPMVGVQLAGHEIGQQFGMAIAQEADPNTNTNTGVVGIILFYLAFFIFIDLGGIRIMLAVLLDSFAHIPIGGYRVHGDIVALLVGMLQTAYELALRVAAPVICILFLQTLSLGFISRTAPSFNVLSLGFPLRVLLGMTVLIGALVIMNESITEDMVLMLEGLFHILR